MPQPTEPIAWYYELATYKSELFGYYEFRAQVTLYEPHVPEGAVRNVIPLYSKDQLNAQPSRTPIQ